MAYYCLYSGKKDNIDRTIGLTNIKYALQNRTGEYAKAMYEDIQEIIRCYKSGTYKATIIMSGAVLEAFLLDWLSENDGVDYFVEPFLKEEVGENGLVFYRATSNLNDYINAIAAIEAPEWMEEKEKAHRIRKSRNVVHMKAFLKEEKDINEETCKDVIGYLQDIINKRIEEKCASLQLNYADYIIRKW